jgi:lipoprotein-anchoring transpeptidase ErfK/SrfK
MQRHVFAALVLGAIAIVPAKADPLYLNSTAQARPAVPAYIAPESQPQLRPPAPIAASRSGDVQYAAAPSDGNMGGGFIEFLFNGGRTSAPQQQQPPSGMMARGEPVEQMVTADPHMQIDPKFQKQLVQYRGSEPPGTVVIDTPNRFLFLVQDNGMALRYGIGVGKPGFSWAGEKKISAKKEWPDWTPPPEMLQRRPDLPHFMAGGPENPLGARAMYLGSSLYRIHGSNEPWTIGQAVSSGCIRMRNEDVIDLYEKVKVGTKVVVI